MSAETSNQETLAMAAGALLSLAFSYIPGLRERYAARTVIVSSFLVIRFSYSTMVSFSDEPFVSSFLIRLWLPSRMRFRIRFIHEKHLRIEQLIWVRLAYEMHAGFHPVWVHCLEIS